MKLSARNQLKGRITAVQKGQTAAASGPGRATSPIVVVSHRLGLRICCRYRLSLRSPGVTLVGDVGVL
jgi:hypothetical protein